MLAGIVMPNGSMRFGLLFKLRSVDFGVEVSWIVDDVGQREVFDNCTARVAGMYDCHATPIPVKPDFQQPWVKGYAQLGKLAFNVKLSFGEASSTDHVGLFAIVCV